MNYGVQAMTSTKVCSKCGIAKPQDQFYRRPGGADGFHCKCKECAKKDARRYVTTRAEPPSTKEGKYILARNQIPCTVGNVAGFPWVDLVAWGCIPIECKRAVEQNAGHFQWGFSPVQNKKRMNSGFVLLIAKYHDPNKERIFVVPAVNNMFYHDSGLRKKALTVTLDSKHGNAHIGDLLIEFENAYHLIEQARLDYAIKLPVIASLSRLY